MCGLFRYDAAELGIDYNETPSPVQESGTEYKSVGLAFGSALLEMGKISVINW